MVFFDCIVLLRTGYRFGMDIGMACSDFRVMQRHADTDANSNPDAYSNADADADADADAYSNRWITTFPGWCRYPQPVTKRLYPELHQQGRQPDIHAGE